MNRFFSSRQRKILKIRSGGLCQECGCRLKKSFHADHVLAHSKGGKTILQNGQALCDNCNMVKGAK